MNALRPSTGIQEKLEQEMGKQREKADKTAKALVSAASKKRARDDVKESKKNKKAKKGSTEGTEAGNPVAEMEAELEDTAAQLRRAEDQSRLEAEADEALQKALAAIKMPTAVPLTTMTGSSSESTAARTKILQEAVARQKAAIQQAEKGPTGDATDSKDDGHDGVELQIGLQAMMSTLRKNGSIRAKPKKVDKDSKQQAVGDVLKLGKHLLK